MFGGPLLIVETRLLLLQMAGVRQDHRAEVDGRRRGIDRSGKALLDEPGNPTAMVQVGMGENDSIDLAGRDRCILPVSLSPFFVALEYATVNQDLKALLAGGIT